MSIKLVAEQQNIECEFSGPSAANRYKSSCHNISRGSKPLALATFQGQSLVGIGTDGHSFAVLEALDWHGPAIVELLVREKHATPHFA